MLHRVAVDSAGPIDSVRSDPQGRYDFRYRRAEGSGIVYFVSAMYGGIAYFSSPLPPGTVSGDDGEITVFDTTATGIALGVRGRHLVVSAPEASGARTVMEVFELANDSARTLVVGGPGRESTWSTAIPEGARDFRVRPSDIAADAARLVNGRVELYAPVPPGLKQVAFSYALPPDRFPLRVPVAENTTVLEILVEDKVARVAGGRVTEASPVTVEGRTFRRFLGQDVPGSAVLTVVVGAPASRERGGQGPILAGLVGLVLLAALVVALRRRPDPAPVLAPAALPWRVSEDLALRIAQLDERASSPAPEHSEHAGLAEQRARLKEQLVLALARERGSG